jgi:hypothetical protein
MKMSENAAEKRNSRRKKFQCSSPGCVYTTSSHQHFSRHKLTHTGEKPFQCQFPGCGFRCNRADNLKNHCDNRHGVKKYYFKCHWCPYVTMSPHNINSHQIIHTADDEFYFLDSEDDDY